jgi:NAD(P)-dependent dehydrogenase (short-subunit alcohol dehydrogenase family)
MKTILITGATDGLGRGVAFVLAKQGHTLLLHGRNPEKGQALLDEIKKTCRNKNLFYYNADFASLGEIMHLADKIKANHNYLGILINNAGLGVEASRRTTKDGLEMIFQVDYLAAYILTKRLLTLLSTSAPARIVNVASAGQAPINFSDPLLEKHWDGVQAYCQAKLAMIMLAFELASDYAVLGVTINALHPATYMPTKIVKGFFPVMSTLEEGVEAVVSLAIDPAFEGVTGKYFDHTIEAAPLAQAYDEKARRQLMELSRKLTKV